MCQGEVRYQCARREVLDFSVKQGDVILPVIPDLDVITFVSDYWGNFVSLHTIPSGSKNRTEFVDDPIMDGLCHRLRKRLHSD